MSATAADTADGAARVDRAERLIQAPPRKLFDAWTDAAVLAAWLPPAGASMTVDALDPRPGGHYALTLAFADSSGKTTTTTDVVRGRFIQLDPPRRLVIEADFQSDRPEFAGTMQMTWEFLPRDGGTLVRVAARNVPPGISAADHAAGLASSLANLARFAEQKD